MVSGEPLPAALLGERRRHPLDAIFAPRSIALIGASDSPGTVGRALMQNLCTGPARFFAVSDKHREVMGCETFRSVLTIAERVDLAVIAVPAAAVPDVISECAEGHVAGAIIISAGFKETGLRGAELETQILERARRGGVRVVGPNCLGVMNPHVGLNATFASSSAIPGRVGFVSQSGALCTAVLDWSLTQKVGFSAFISVGSMLDVGWGDVIDYLGDDSRTKGIVLYMESIGDARSFLSAAREVAMSKPIIVVKVGRSAAAAKAAASHTGALTGSDDVVDAAFRRAGVLRVRTIAELFNMVEIVAHQPRPAGPRLTIVTNAGGPGVLATDMLIDSGGELAPLSGDSIAQLNDILAPHWSHGNPIDVLGDASAERYCRAVEIASNDPGNDGVLVILAPQAMTDPTETARKLAEQQKHRVKPVLASWIGGKLVQEGCLVLSECGIPTFDYPDDAARAFCHMWQYSSNLDALYETPTMSHPADCHGCEIARRIVEDKRPATGTGILTEFDSKRVLEAYGIDTAKTITANSEDDAVAAAAKIGFPVVLKLLSRTITHKSEVGGVKLNLCDPYAVKHAYHDIQRSVAEKVGPKHFHGVTVQPMIQRCGFEIILGSSVDPQFGPVLLFGGGGTLVEIYKDRELGLPPLNATLARRMMERTRIFQALKGVRGQPPVNLDGLANCLVRFSELVVDLPAIKEIDINPLLVSSEQIITLDARIVVYGLDVPRASLPRPAIRPYPMQYVFHHMLKEGPTVTIRPIRPEDEPLMVQFHRSLSEDAVRHRYLATLSVQHRIAHEQLRRICFNDFDQGIVLVAEFEGKLIGVARLSKPRVENDAEFSIVICDAWQRKGLGTELLRRLVQVGRAEHVRRITGRMLADNHEMIAVSRKLGFTFDDELTADTRIARLDMN
jgi:acetyltransferase